MIGKMAGAAAKKGSRMPGAGMRDAAYQWAGGLGKKGRREVAGSHAQRVLGRKRLRNTALGGGGIMAVRTIRGSGDSSGGGGLQPHSMGGTTMM